MHVIIVCHHTRRTSNAGQNLKIIRQMLAMLGLFAICWLPYFILSMVQYYGISLDLLPLIILSNYVAFRYLAVNPILFAYYTNSIRDKIKSLIGRHSKLRKQKQSYPTKQSKNWQQMKYSKVA